MSLEESSSNGSPGVTDQDYQRFFFMQDLDAYGANGKTDVPFSDEFLLNNISTEPYLATTIGGLPSPNSSNPDLPGSGRQSPLLPSLGASPGGYGFFPSDGISGLDDDCLDSHMLQQSQESRTHTGSNTGNSRPSTNQTFLDASNNFLGAQVQQGEPSMESSSSTNEGQYQAFTASSEGSFCVPEHSLQSCAATTPSNVAFEQKVPNGMATSTHVSIAPKAMNNTNPSSVSANLQNSPTSNPQHFIRHPSLLRHQIHRELPQYSPFALTATSDYTSSQVPHTMSSGNNITNRQEPRASPSLSRHHQYLSNGAPSRRMTSPCSQSRGSPVSQNYQPFQESSLRTSVTSKVGANPWEAGQTGEAQYPDPQPVFQQQQQQTNRSPYMGHHHISGSQRDSTISYTPEQYRNSRDAFFISQEPSGFGFNGSSPLSVKRKTSSPGSDHVVSDPVLKSQTASPKPQTKRRGKQEPKNHDDNELVINPVALQTEDLTNLDPGDDTNVAALIDAMHNTNNVEDNLGMQKTWDKVRKLKALRIREVCVELLKLTKQAQQQNGTPLGEKRPINQYSSFGQRFDALCETLRFQKTVCKHLIEPPYSYIVVDDPQYAKDRVKNNRRVNHQKAEAIRLGREHLGEKGQGKGKPMLKTKKRGHAQIDDSQDDADNSGDEPLSDGETDASPRSFGHKSARPNPRTPKRPKRSTDNNQHQEQNGSIEATNMPQVYNQEDPFAQGLYQHAYGPSRPTQIFSEHDRMLHALAPSQQMSNLNQSYDIHSGNGFGNCSYGDNSTGGSDSDGLGGPGYGPL